MKTRGTSLFALISLALVACGQPEPAKDPSSSTMTTAAEPKKSAPEAKPVVEEAKPAAEPAPTPAPAPVAEEKAEPCPQDWICVNVALDSGKITKRDTKLIGDPKVETTWSKSVDTRAAASFDQASKPVEVALKLPQSKPGEHLANVVLKFKGREILLDKHTGEEVTYVGVIAAEKDGQFMVDLRYMK
jgi:hypothetical protein